MQEGKRRIFQSGTRERKKKRGRRDEQQREEGRGGGGGGVRGGVEEEEENSLVSIRGKRRPSRCRPMKTDGDSPPQRERKRRFSSLLLEGSKRCSTGRRAARQGKERNSGNMPSPPFLSLSLGLRSQINNIPISSVFL